MRTRTVTMQPGPLRADARRNREQIIEAARTLFLRLGPDVPMEEIARSAGVGVGTLYRRFPDRDELIKAVSLDTFSRLAELATRAEREEPDPATALTRLLHSALELHLGLATASMSAPGKRALMDSPEVSAYRTEAIAVVGRLVRRAQQEGTIRPDIGPGDVAVALAVVSRFLPPALLPTDLPPTENDLADMARHRLFTLMIDGLRTTPGTPLPGRPIEDQDVETLRRQRTPF
ncbi:TetR/AcrR family transcriptional regulator [Actinoplanes sp. NPDC051851]|uniref:TetR/AcrR family transcriptional regulator n=1 Tax=Actinoplanes sp. NPDC051851 TaxID=3154753 RepID=UPI00343A39D3